MNHRTLKIKMSANKECEAKPVSLAHQVVFFRAGSPICRVPVSLYRRFYQICIAADAKIADQEGLNATQFGALICLYDEPGLDQNSLTARLGIDRSHTSTLLDELEANDFVERKVSTADRRAKLVCLTRKGVETRDRLRPKAEVAQAGPLAPLSPADRERFLDTLLNIIEANEACAHSGASPRKSGASSGKVAKWKSRNAAQRTV